MTNTDIEKSILINACPETVWFYLTDKDKLGTWYHPAKESFVAGEDYELYKIDDDGKRVPMIWGRVLEMEAFSKIVTTFVITPFGDSETTVKWSLDPVHDGTRLSLVHSGVAEATGDAAMQLLMALDKGWDTHLSDLRETIDGITHQH